jgi:hypothetical protein
MQNVRRDYPNRKRCGKPSAGVLGAKAAPAAVTHGVCVEQNAGNPDAQMAIVTTRDDDEEEATNGGSVRRSV